jgi:hypothetical protein
MVLIPQNIVNGGATLKFRLPKCRLVYLLKIFVPEFLTNKFQNLPCRRAIVAIASDYRTEDQGFEPRQGVRFLGLYTLQLCCQNSRCIAIVFA